MSEEAFHDCVDYSPPSQAEMTKIGVISESHISTSDVESQATAPTRDNVTQTTYSSYPTVVDNAGTILRQIANLTTAVTSALNRIQTSRDHMEVRREVDYLADQVRKFLNFHRNKIAEYVTAVVDEGSRTAIRNMLREQANAVIMPVLNELDALRRHNLELGARGDRFDLAAYRRRVEVVRDLQQSFGGLRSLTPTQHLC